MVVLAGAGAVPKRMTDIGLETGDQLAASGLPGRRARCLLADQLVEGWRGRIRTGTRRRVGGRRGEGPEGRRTRPARPPD